MSRSKNKTVKKKGTTERRGPEDAKELSSQRHTPKVNTRLKLKIRKLGIAKVTSGSPLVQSECKSSNIYS